MATEIIDRKEQARLRRERIQASKEARINKVLEDRLPPGVDFPKNNENTENNTDQNRIFKPASLRAENKCTKSNRKIVLCSNIIVLVFILLQYNEYFKNNEFFRNSKYSVLQNLANFNPTRNYLISVLVIYNTSKYFLLQSSNKGSLIFNTLELFLSGFINAKLVYVIFAAVEILMNTLFEISICIIIQVIGVYALRNFKYCGVVYDYLLEILNNK